MIVALAGGVGGAKLAHGLYQAPGAESLVVIVNTGDDFDLFGLRIMPDADTVLYTLAGLANPETGWGVVGDTSETLEMLRRYGEHIWFHLGDRDFATHILRTQRLRAGWTPTRILAAFTEALAVRARLLPMSDDPVATLVRTPAGELDFQDYFVRRHQEDDVLGVRFAGIEAARLPADVQSAIDTADAIIFCPSNPIVSIGPILAVPGMREAIASARVPRIAVSPLIGGRALKGPADRMLATLGVEVSSFGVGQLYSDLLDGIVIDHADSADATRIEALGMRVLVADTLMRDDADRRRLAEEVLHFAQTLSHGGRAAT